MYYLNILYCNVLSEDSCPASDPVLTGSLFEIFLMVSDYGDSTVLY